MTGLRLWKIGPAEVLVFLWCLHYFPRRTIPNGILLRFFLVFLGSMAIGTLIGLIITPQQTDMEDWATWIYLTFITLGMYQGLRKNSLSYNEALLYRFAVTAILMQLILYLLGNLGVRYVLGAPLWFYNRYSGGGTNPHQVAVMMCGLTFVFSREMLKKRYLFWNMLLMLGCVMILMATKASTGVLALTLSTVLELMVLINRTIKSRRYKLFAVLLEMLIGALIMLLLYRVLYRFAYSWIANDSNGLGRLEIFSNIQYSFEKSPIFGLGPGTHSQTGGRLIEYHNTYLDVLASSGLVGSFALLIFTIRLIFKIKYDNRFLPVVAVLYAYGFAGFAMRRLVFWGILTLSLVICEQIGQNMSAQGEMESR